MTDKRDAAFEEIQLVYTKYNLSAEDGLALSSDTLVWSLLLTFAELDGAVNQFKALVPGIEEQIVANFPAVSARRKLLLEMEEAGCSGWVQ